MWQWRQRAKDTMQATQLCLGAIQGLGSRLHLQACCRQPWAPLVPPTTSSCASHPGTFFPPQASVIPVTSLSEAPASLWEHSLYLEFSLLPKYSPGPTLLSFQDQTSDKIRHVQGILSALCSSPCKAVSSRGRCWIWLWSPFYHQIASGYEAWECLGLFVTNR
jgi:hypothetical protein